MDKHFAALDTVVPSAVIADVDLPHLSHDGTTGLERQMVVTELKQLGAVAGALAPLGAAAVAGAEPQESSIWNPRRIDKMRGTANPLPPEVGRGHRANLAWPRPAYHNKLISMNGGNMSARSSFQ